MERGVVHFLKEFQLAIESVSSVATVSLKANEPGLVELCERYGWSLCAYEPEELDRVDGVLNPSEIVKKFIGTSTVAEGACLKNLVLSCLFRSKSTLGSDVGKSWPCRLQDSFNKRTRGRICKNGKLYVVGI